MTLDEAIKLYKQIIIDKDVFCSTLHCMRSCDDCVKESSQIVAWLEELKTLRLNSCMLHMPERLQIVESGYKKGIDDFEKNLKEAIGYITFNPIDEELFIDIIDYTAEFLRRNYVGNNKRQKNN